MKNMTLAFLACMTLTTPIAMAAEDHAGMDHSMMEKNTSAGDYYAQSRQDMHKAMDVKPTGNADKDFVLNMIPHHEGAVEMAKVELEHGKDPELRKLAEDIIKAQDKEIAFMKEWLKKH